MIRFRNIVCDVQSLVPSVEGHDFRGHCLLCGGLDTLANKKDHIGLSHDMLVHRLLAVDTHKHLAHCLAGDRAPVPF